MEEGAEDAPAEKSVPVLMPEEDINEAGTIGKVELQLDNMSIQLFLSGYK